MSKCKAVLDGEKITTIQVMVKNPPVLPDVPRTKSPEQQLKQVPVATAQQPK